VTPTTEQVQRLAPQAKAFYIQAFALAAEVLARNEINTGLRVAHFMAQVLHESGGLLIARESMTYSSPERLMEVWPSRFKTPGGALPFVRNPEALAEAVYGGRMGNTEPGDGFRFRGHGMLQTTGRESYARYGKELGIDLVGDPDLAIDPRYALALAAAEWKASGCNPFADADSLVGVTRRINGGTVGLTERAAWLTKTKAVWANNP
jgi:putative chitinase